MFAHVYLCLPMFTMFTRACLRIFTRFPRVYLCLYLFTCLSPFTRVDLYVPMFSPFYLSLLVFTYVYHRLTVLVFIMITDDYLCLPICLHLFTYVFHCLQLFTGACLHIFTHVYSFLPTFTLVYLWLPPFIWFHLFTRVYLCLPCLLCHVYLFYPYIVVFTYDYICLPMFTRFLVYTCLLEYHWSIVFTTVYSCLDIFTHA